MIEEGKSIEAISKDKIEHYYQTESNRKRFSFEFFFGNGIETLVRI